MSTLAEEIRKALTPGHTDATRLIRLHTGSASVSLLVESLSGVEQVGPAPASDTCRAGFAFDLRVLANDAGLLAEDWLGKPILIELLTQQSRFDLRPFHGHITAFEQLTADGAFGYYRLRVEPWLALLAQRRDSFVFHDLSVPEILEAVFADYQGQATLVPQWRLELRDASLYPRRSTCTQYRETDLAFVERLMAEEGLFYWFEHSASGSLDSASHTLVIADANDAFAENAQTSIRFHRAAHSEADDTIQSLALSREIATHSIELASWDYRSLDIRGVSAQAQADEAAAEMPLMRFDAPGAYIWPTREQGERYATRQTEALAAQRQIHLGGGTVRTLSPGTCFTLMDHFDADMPSDIEPEARNRYVVLRVEHRARNNLNPSLTSGLAEISGEQSAHLDEVASTPEAPLYANTFSVLPAYLPYRPVAEDERGITLRPRPTVHGTQTAIAVGEAGNSAGQPVHTDRDGRIRVQFHWQRGSQSHSRLQHPSGSEDASADSGTWSWVRVMQSWAGANWGGHFVPRVGQEVLVEFCEGDIDRPIVIGALYNGQGAANAQNNQIASGAGAAIGAAPAWFAGDAEGGRHSREGGNPASSTTNGERHAHPATLAGFKTQAISASQQGSGGFNQLVFDLSPQEPRTQLATTQFATALNLGAIRHQFGNQRLAYRGHGAELITQASGALRAGSGLLLSTDARANAAGMQMDAKLSEQQLEAAHALVTTLADSAKKQKADLLDDPEASKLPAAEALKANQESLAETETQAEHQHGGSGTATAWRHPHIAAESPAGIGALTPKDAILNAGTTATLAAQDIHLAALGKSAWAVKDGIVLYAYGKASDGNRPVQDKGLMLHAAKGKVSVQAQSDKADLNAHKKITVSSTTADILLQGKNELALIAAGAALQISGGDITLTAPGKVSLLASQRNFTGPQSASAGESLAGSSTLTLEQYERLRLDEQFVLRDQESGHPLAGAPYRIEDDTGTVVARGITDREGATERVRSSRGGKLKVYWGH